MIVPQSVKEWVRYDPLLGKFHWIARPFKSRVVVGDAAENFGADGRAFLKISGVMYSGVKLAWWFVFGTYPDKYDFVVHLDGNKSNLAIQNLELKKNIKHPELTQEVLQNYLDYDPESGIITRKRAYHSADIGSVCGSIDGDGYLTLSLFNKTFRTHRIAWVIVHGQIPDGLVIDHKDRNRQNNKLENLRLTCHQGNADNKDWSDWYTKWFIGRHGRLPSAVEMDTFLQRH